ncbi:MAG TPA: YmdB family metallophosphoesterase [Candidatus Dormibacteraeota bacterium]|nr:YmdB family metallophosphoesterase [Candidatus Dormibacteraeota bacterium]
MRVLFFGDVVGIEAVRHLAARIPQWRREAAADLVIANAENAVVSRPESVQRGFGTSDEAVDLLLGAGVDVLTGGNHSWDAPDADRVLRRPRVLRPMNLLEDLPGTGIERLVRAGRRVAVVNLIGRSAAHPHITARDPVEAFASLSFEDDELVIVDFHAEMVTEKHAFAFAADGQAAAVVGTHTHEPSLLMHRLPLGTLFCADAGMNGPSGGIVGIAHEVFVRRLRGADAGPFALAGGPFQLGAVLMDLGDEPRMERFWPSAA